MHPHTPAWKNNVDDLRSLAQAVELRGPAPTERLSARAVARALSGVVSFVVQKWGMDAMQRACADIVRHQPTWTSKLGLDMGTALAKMPAGPDGAPTDPVRVIGWAAHGFLQVATAAHVRCALAFWATEDSPQAWYDLAVA